VKHKVGDFKLDFGQFNVLVGVKGFSLIKLAIAAAANFRFNLYGICRLKQLLTVPGVALLTAALAFALFVLGCGFLKGPSAEGG
jgi:hypothetical protein